MSDGRKQYADIYKGIAIFLVILGHSPICNNYLKQLIYTFHMPAFFLIYGLVYSLDRHQEKGFIFWRFILNKAQRLLLPCYIWGLIYMVLNGNITVKGLAFWLYGNQIGFRNAGSLTSLWFLPCMFVAVIGFECLMKISYQKLQKKTSLVLFTGVACLCIFISWLLPNLTYGYPWSLDVSFMALAFILIGYLLQEAFTAISKLKNPGILALSGVLAAVILLLTFRLNLNYISINNVDMASRNYGNIFLYFVDALAGSFILLVLSIGLSHIKLVNMLSFPGKNTMQIFIFHKPIVIFLSTLLEGTVLYNSIGGYITSIITFVICILLTILANRFIPFLFGMKRSSRGKDFSGILKM